MVGKDPPQVWVLPHGAPPQLGVTIGGMGFFDDVPVAEPEPPRPHHPWEPPEAEFPGLVPVNIVLLGRTEQAAVAITGLSAYAAGFEVFVTARFRPRADGGSGERRPDAPGDLAAARRSFRLGLQLADGTRVIGQHGGPGPDHDSAPAGPILRPFLGGGGPRSHFSRWWAWPLPPAGPLEFVCEWPAFGITETRAGIDAQLILNAAGQSIRLWPEHQG